MHRRVVWQAEMVASLGDFREQLGLAGLQVTAQDLEFAPARAAVACGELLGIAAQIQSDVQRGAGRDRLRGGGGLGHV